MKAGDLVFIKGKSLISHLVRFFDKGDFSHIAVAVSDTHIIEAAYNTKVRIDKMRYEDYEVVDLGISDKDRDTIVHEAIQLVGKRYDYLQVLGVIFSERGRLGTPDSLICSELAYRLLNSININLGDEFITPNQLYEVSNEYKKRID